MPAYTHTGFQVRLPRRGGGRRFDHLNAATSRANARHALTDAGAAYRAACGVIVLRRYGNDDDLDGPITGHVSEGTAGVTCERCRKILES